MASQDTNFRLSETELQLVEHVDFFTQKRRILNSIQEAFGRLEQLLVHDAAPHRNWLPAELLTERGRISRGENLGGLPWMMLDCPYYFSRDAIFAFRSLFWWGHPFSITLHLSGRYAATYGKVLLGSWNELSESLLFCINPKPFEHHFGPDNYATIGHLKMTGHHTESQIIDHGFMKITHTVPLRNAETMIPVFREYFSEMLRLMRK
jgi:hypothetical protein